MTPWSGRSPPRSGTTGSVTIGNLPEVVSEDEWWAARRELLAKEKELTRRRDRLNAERRRLPLLRIEKEGLLAAPKY